MVDKLASIFCRVFFVIALLLFFSACLDSVLQFFGWRLSWPYEPAAVLEYSGIIMVLVIGLLLRQIREELKK
jgi:uncharacterized integral membrane protein